MARARDRRLQGDDARRCRTEAARTDVEGFQRLIEVDVKPLAARGACPVGGKGHEPGGDPSAAGGSGDKRVQDEGMASAIPGNVDPADEVPVAPRRDPAEAVALDLTAPVVRADRVPETFRVQGFDLWVLK